MMLLRSVKRGAPLCSAAAACVLCCDSSVPEKSLNITSASFIETQPVGCSLHASVNTVKLLISSLSYHHRPNRLSICLYSYQS
jgi:hypothetical protein